MIDATDLPLLGFVLGVAVACFAGLRLATRFEGVGLRLLPCLLIAVATGGLTRLLVSGTITPGYAVWTLLLVTGLACLAAIDARTRTVPDLISVPMIALGLVHAATLDGLFLVFALSATAIVALGILTARLLGGSSGWMGSGDVLLLAGAVAWLGPAMLPDLLLLTAFGLIPQFLFHLGTRKPIGADQPLAPTLGLAQVVIWLGGPIF